MYNVMEWNVLENRISIAKRSINQSKIVIITLSKKGKERTYIFGRIGRIQVLSEKIAQRARIENGKQLFCRLLLPIQFRSKEEKSSVINLDLILFYSILRSYNSDELESEIDLPPQTKEPNFLPE